MSINDKDWAATNYLLQASATADFATIAATATGAFDWYVAGGQPLRADAIVNLTTVPAGGWYVRARGENAAGTVTSAWTETIFVKTGEANTSKSYTTYSPNYTGERTRNTMLSAGIVGDTFYVLYSTKEEPVTAGTAETSTETISLLPVTTAGVKGSAITVATNSSGQLYETQMGCDDKVYVSWFLNSDYTSCLWRSYDGTLGTVQTITPPSPYTTFGYGSIWRTGAVLALSVWEFGATTNAHFGCVEAKTDNTVHVLTQTHPDDGYMSGNSSFGFWYPYVGDYDAYLDYGVAYLGQKQSNSIWFQEG